MAPVISIMNRKLNFIYIYLTFLYASASTMVQQLLMGASMESEISLG